jgi:HAE1 family hydrophobic/amphiphilic exporter-1
MKQSGSNTVEVVDAVKKRWAELEKGFPEGIKSYPVFDQGKIVGQVTSRTASSGLWGALLAVIVLYLFLRNFRPTFAIAVAIPLSSGDSTLHRNYLHSALFCGLHFEHHDPCRFSVRCWNAGG